jgi:hypothetical protein
MTKTIRKDGYISVWDNGEQYLEHRRLAQLFIPNPENKPCVNHKDGNRSNNDINNLEWVTYSENHIHAYRVLGRRINNKNSAKGEKHPLSKLKIEQVENIRKSNMSGVSLAKQYNVSTSLISNIKNNKKWI